MFMRMTGLVAILGLVWVCAGSTASAQTLDQRIAHMQQRRQQAAAAQARAEALARNRTTSALNTTISNVDFSDVPAKQAVKWVAEVAGFNLIVNWTTLEASGIDPEQPVDIQMSRITANKLLQLILVQISGDIPLVMQTDPDFVRIMTKEQANQTSIIRVYSIGDMLMDIPDFTDAPQFDLNQIASDTDSGSSSDIFSDTDNDDEIRLTRAERAERIADLIRQSLEPDIWEANGGTAGRITFFQNNLIVRAPAYVHGRIGIPGVAARPAAPRALPPGIGFDPQIGVVNSGAKIDGTGTVSRDRRYVTFSGTVSNAQVEAIRTFGTQYITPQGYTAPGLTPGQYYPLDPGAGVSGIDRSQLGR